MDWFHFVNDEGGGRGFGLAKSSRKITGDEEAQLGRLARADSGRSFEHSIPHYRILALPNAWIACEVTPVSGGRRGTVDTLVLLESPGRKKDPRPVDLLATFKTLRKSSGGEAPAPLTGCSRVDRKSLITEIAHHDEGHLFLCCVLEALTGQVADCAGTSPEHGLRWLPALLTESQFLQCSVTTAEALSEHMTRASGVLALDWSRPSKGTSSAFNQQASQLLRLFRTEGARVADALDSLACEPKNLGIDHLIAAVPALVSLNGGRLPQVPWKTLLGFLQRRWPVDSPPWEDAIHHAFMQALDQQVPDGVCAVLDWMRESAAETWFFRFTADQSRSITNLLQQTEHRSAPPQQTVKSWLALLKLSSNQPDAEINKALTQTFLNSPVAAHADTQWLSVVKSNPSLRLALAARIEARGWITGEASSSLELLRRGRTDPAGLAEHVGSVLEALRQAPASERSAALVRMMQKDKSMKTPQVWQVQVVDRLKHGPEEHLSELVRRFRRVQGSAGAPLHLPPEVRDSANAQANLRALIRASQTPAWHSLAPSTELPALLMKAALGAAPAESLPKNPLLQIVSEGLERQSRANGTARRALLLTLLALGSAALGAAGAWMALRDSTIPPSPPSQETSEPSIPSSSGSDAGGAPSSPDPQSTGPTEDKKQEAEEPEAEAPGAGAQQEDTPNTNGEAAASEGIDDQQAPAQETTGSKETPPATLPDPESTVRDEPDPAEIAAPEAAPNAPQESDQPVEDGPTQPDGSSAPEAAPEATSVPPEANSPERAPSADGAAPAPQPPAEEAPDDAASPPAEPPHKPGEAGKG